MQATELFPQRGVTQESGFTYGDMPSEPVIKSEPNQDEYFMQNSVSEPSTEASGSISPTLQETTPSSVSESVLSPAVGDIGSTLPLSESTQVSTTTTENEPVKKKQRRKKSALDDLLSCADWYVTSLAGDSNRVRESSLKFGQIKEELREVNHKLNQEEDDDVVKREETEEEKTARLEREEKKRQLQEKRKATLAKRAEEKNLQKQKRLESARLRKERIANGEIIPKKQSAGVSLSELLEGASYFTSIVSKHNESQDVDVGQVDRDGLFFRKTLKKVERYVPEIEHKKKVHKVKKMFKSKISDAEKERAKALKIKEREKLRAKAKAAKAKAKAKAKANKNKKIKEEPELESEDEGLEEQNEEEVEEEEEEEEEEGTWFLSVTASTEFKILESQKVFRPEVYENQEIHVPADIALRAPFDEVKDNLGNYQLDHPNFKPTDFDLVYPLSNYKEKFYLCLPSKVGIYNPFDDLGRTIELISITFLPEEHRKKVIDPENIGNCILGKYIQSFTEENHDKLMESINEFNQLITELKEDPSKPINKYCINRTSFPTGALYEVLNQCYGRTVLPRSNKLKSYKAFSNYVYGELMPSFLSIIYKQLGLGPSSKFIDLGSGVGNCTIQSALEFGAESYGVEIMEHASNLGDLQLTEFQNRCKVFGFNIGKTKLFGRQSFIDNPEVKEVVDQCDAILCNNYLFDAQLNKKVTDELFANLKPGTKIASLKPIVPPGHRIQWDNIDSILNRIKTMRFTYSNNSVSWTSNGGYYYISEVMNDIVDENFVAFQSRSKRDTYNVDESSRERTPLNAFTHNV